MTDSKPVVYLLYGDNAQTFEEHVNDFYQNLDDANTAEMNFTKLEGPSTNLNAIKEAALAMPFLAARRIVVVRDALKPFRSKKAQSDFLTLLDILPPSTALVLIVPDTYRFRQGQRHWETLSSRHWLMKWVKGAGERVYLIECVLPTKREMPGWVQQKVRALGGQFTPQAAAVLADYVGNNTQRAMQEIEKLLTYTANERPVDDDDVRRLTAQDQEGDIFELVDAIGHRDGKKALEMLHILLEDNDLIPIFGMIVRQFRLILQAREIIEEGGTSKTVAQTLHQHPFVAQKITQQCQKFDLPTLESLYQRLLEIDIGMKTGQMPGELALDLLITRLAA
jgi:DNA polymerase III subunit delta